jgi:hypothetical protein
MIEGATRLAGLFLACVAWPALAAGPPPRATKAPQTDVASLPAPLQGVISARFGADNPAYRFVAEGARYRTMGARQAFTATMGADGLAVSAGSGEWRLRVTSWGRGTSQARATSGAVTASENRVGIERGGLEEWWVNGPLGLEQGWTVAAAPRHGKGPLTLTLVQSGRLKATAGVDDRALTIADAAGRTVLRYSGLAAYDAMGRELPARFEIAGEALRVRVDDAGAVYPVRIDPWVQMAELTASDGATADYLGTSVAVSNDGSTVVAGASLHRVGTAVHQGAVYVFVKPAWGWANATQAAELTASDGAVNDSLGWAVAVSADGSTVVAGAPGHQVGSHASQGAAYVFLKPSTGWASGTETGELTASDGASYDWLGISIAVSSDGSVVMAGAGAHEVGSNLWQGVVYVFLEPRAGWASATQAAELTASDGASGDQLGTSLAVSGDASTAIAGAPYRQIGSNENQGAAYVFVKPAGGWGDGTQTAEFSASRGTADDYFGWDVAVSADGSIAATGAPGHQVASNGGQGAAYVFVKPIAGWADATETAELTASDGTAGDDLGVSVTVSGDGSTIVAGACYHPVAENPQQGSAYLFIRPSDGWASGTETAELDVLGGGAYDQFGGSVATSGDGSTVVGGAPWRRVGSNSRQGAAYVLQTTGLELTPHELISRLYPREDRHQALTLTNDGANTADYQTFAIPVATTWPHMSPMTQPSVPNTHASLGRAPSRRRGTPSKVGSLPYLNGVPAFGMDLSTDDLVYWPAITSPASWSTVAPEPGASYWGGAFLLGDFTRLYVVDAMTDAFATIDTATGSATAIGTAVPNPGDTWVGLTATNTGIMYGAGTPCNGTTSDLYTIDPTTGAATLVGTITNAPCLINIAADAAGELYGVDIWNNNLVKIDPATGAGTVVGPTGIVANYVQGLSFDMVSGTLYWAAFNDTTSRGELRVIDTATGASTLIGAFPNGDEVDAFAIASFVGPTLPWLTLTPGSGSVDPGTSVPIDAHFVADGADHFGVSRAMLHTNTDTPYPVNNVPVCFTKAFLDVPEGYWADAFIHAVAGARITPGFAGTFNPQGVMTRGTMARWLLLGRYGNLYAPPPCRGIFADVDCENTANSDWIEDLYNKGITAGCNADPLMYCPDDPVNRAAMAVFMIKANEAVGYTPPACTGIFDDVPCPSMFADWIEELYNRGITAGCGGNNFCPDVATTRDQEAVFVTKNWGLPTCPANGDKPTQR